MREHRRKFIDGNPKRGQRREAYTGRRANSGASGKGVAALPRSALAMEFEKAKHLKEFYNRYTVNRDAAPPELKYYAAAAVEGTPSSFTHNAMNES